MAAARAWAALRRERSLPRDRRIAGPLSVAAISGGATLATAPFSVLAFGTMKPAALVSNVLAVPLAGFVVPSLALTLALAALLPAAAPLVAGAATVGLDALDAVARLAGALPLASVPFERKLLAALVLAAVGAILLRPYPRTGRRAALRALRGRGTLAAGLALCAAAWWPLVPGGTPGYRSHWLALHFLAVGEGDAAAIATPAGRWIVVDGGPRGPGFDAGASVVAPFLRRNGVEAARHGRGVARRRGSPRRDAGGGPGLPAGAGAGAGPAARQGGVSALPRRGGARPGAGGGRRALATASCWTA